MSFARLFSAACAGLLACSLNVRGAELWTPLPAGGSPGLLAAKRATSSQLHRLNEPALRDLLAQAPLEGANEEGQRLIISLPAPDGTLQRFAVEESSLMEPALQAKFPDIRSYAARGVDDPALSARLDISPAGFHGQVIGRLGRWLIDPLPEAGQAVYQTYTRRAAVPPAEKFQCGVSELQQKQMFGELRRQSLPPTTDLTVAGSTRRTFRLAVAASKEYTNRFGGTVSGAMAAINTAINRVTGIYQTELSVSFTLVANNDQIIYTNANPGPYSNNDASAALTQNQTNLTAVIGAANYDIGHVFTTGSGGLAQLGVICRDTLKAQGTTGLANPTGDAFYVDYVCHEFGHQFGANHTFNSTQGSCGGGNRENGTAYEPGSGTTIMAYSGLCGSDNTQNQVDAFFHAASFNEITNYLATVSCGTTTGNGGNNPPNLTAPAAGTVIPNNTPFRLTATGSDPDSDALTYSWEEYDLGPAGGLSTADNGFSPLFRSFPPTTSPTRNFPRLAVLRGEEAADSERLPTFTGASTRTMNFRVTARDNRGGVRQAATSISIATAAGPFRVTSQSTSATLTGGSTQTVTWNVAGTTANGINTSQVNIRLSTDGGVNFSTVLASAVPNNGSATVTLPSVDAANCRLMVEAVGNIFFAINGANLTINTSGQALSSRLINVSTRLSVQTGEAVAIGGFVVAGTGTKRVIVRGIGPSLSAFGITAPLANPTLELYSGQTLLQSNDNWRATQQTEIQNSGFAPTSEPESALVANLAPGSYTAILRGSSGGTGVGLVEVYDLDSGTPTARLTNISTRGRVLSGDSIVIGGFVVNGNANKRVIVRAIGPSLTNFGISGALTDPVLVVKNSSGTTIAENDDWQTPSSNASLVTGTGFAPSSGLESAVVLNLAPGSYTALVSGFDGAVGVGLVEVYELP
ncbi:MAG: hypothetical protein JSR82_15675 [Verrucomicrobia bacterium]|nr:hypothetical protein [Verrucomicrobiota bacterium]